MTAVLNGSHHFPIAPSRSRVVDQLPSAGRLIKKLLGSVCLNTSSAVFSARDECSVLFIPASDRNRQELLWRSTSARGRGCQQSPLSWSGEETTPDCFLRLWGAMQASAAGRAPISTSAMTLFSNGVQRGHCSVARGLPWPCLRREETSTVVFVGDGALGEGALYEGMKYIPAQKESGHLLRS